MKKILKWTFIGVFLAVIAVGGFYLWILFGSKTSNPNNYKTIGDIPEPWGYERISGDEGQDSYDCGKKAWFLERRSQD